MVHYRGAHDAEAGSESPQRPACGERVGEKSERVFRADMTSDIMRQVLP
jgi:hypothetical protein